MSDDGHGRFIIFLFEIIIIAYKIIKLLTNTHKFSYYFLICLKKNQRETIHQK